MKENLKEKRKALEREKVKDFKRNIKIISRNKNDS